MKHNINDFLHGLVAVHDSLPTELYRMPVAVLDNIRPAGAEKYIKTAGNEIRFVMQGEHASVTLDLGETRGVCEIYLGDFLLRVQPLGVGEQLVQITKPELLDYYKKYKQAHNQEFVGYNLNVVRLVIRAATLSLVKLCDEIEPVTSEHLPKLKYVAYGTSITQGEHSSAPRLNYPRLVARTIGAQVINLGVGGQAHCEPAIAQYMANELDWDFATCCISVNMLQQGVTVAAFRERVFKFLEILVSSHPTKPVFCISVLPFFSDLDMPEDGRARATATEYRDTLNEVVKELSSVGEIYYLHGPDILTDVAGLTCDFLHPNDFGFMEIAKNLSAAINQVLNR